MNLTLKNKKYLKKRKQLLLLYDLNQIELDLLHLIESQCLNYYLVLTENLSIKRKNRKLLKKK